ncbi:MAG: hypothetical protein OIF50_00470 [Flavobacteriaceae bacterium]|nr:hypothetical protein [Flavobacteriaceae bacterium]
MGSEVIILPIIFGTIIGMYYLYIKTRNKERLALIEKDGDASMFFNAKQRSITPMWKVLVINLATLSMGIGLGVMVASVLDQSTNVDAYIYPACIFIFAGLGLLTGFFITNNQTKQ